MASSGELPLRALRLLPFVVWCRCHLRRLYMYGGLLSVAIALLFEGVALLCMATALQFWGARLTWRVWSAGTRARPCTGVTSTGLHPAVPRADHPSRS
eukprot:458488-Rhodomonas_salina.1